MFRPLRGHPQAV